MLEHLIIQNYALIDNLDIPFYGGFTAITGETGAGKSILMDALDLVLGKRADTQVLLNTDRKCIVEGTFSNPGKLLDSFFEENNLDKDSVIILRREIIPNGKSRAFINDTPVNLSVLKTLGDRLVDIHAQHATTSLQDSGFQLSILDSFAGCESMLSQFQEQFRQLRNLKNQLKELIGKEEESRRSCDYKQFLLDELIQANLDASEQEELETRLNVMTHAEEIKSHLYNVIEILSGEEFGVIDRISTAESNLQKVSGFHNELAQVAERLATGLIDLKEILREISAIDQGVDFSADQLAKIQERLDLIYRLQLKHQVRTCRELLEIKENLENELRDYHSIEDQILALENAINSAEDHLFQKATELSEARIKHFKTFSNLVVNLLQHMGMPEARFEVNREKLAEVTLYGQDNIEFYFNANKGHSLKPIADIASGGELSRVMLAIKSLISNKKMLPTIVFDEIDNGLSGDVAGRVGDVLTRMSSGIQVIAITHLPQIAGKADHQYTVYKETKGHVTYSNIKLLDGPGRLAELAVMIGGRETSAASVAAARELLAPSSEGSKLFDNN